MLSSFSRCSKLTDTLVRTVNAGGITSNAAFRRCSNDAHEKQTNLSKQMFQKHSKGISMDVGQRAFNYLPLLVKRTVSVYSPLRQEIKNEEVDSTRSEDVDSDEKPNPPSDSNAKAKQKVERHMNKDRSNTIPLETSMRYLKSAAFKQTYGDGPVWVRYRRNFPGQFAPKKTRETCIRNNKLSTGNPCPICRDEYLLVHHQNVDLLKQFISPYNGEVIGWDKTGVCRHQHERLLIAIDKAKDYGLITFDVPFREYDYDEYTRIYESY